MSRPLASSAPARPGVFVAGEMIDWQAPTGGYLLQACFATGAAAGRGRWGGSSEATANSFALKGALGAQSLDLPIRHYDQYHPAGGRSPTRVAVGSISATCLTEASQ